VALGIAVIGSIGTAVYRLQTSRTIPAGVPRQAAAAAHESLASATAEAARLPHGLGMALLDAARPAFTHGLNIAAAVSIMIAVGLALLAVVAFRDRHPATEAAGATARPRSSPSADAESLRPAGITG
jgi:DHA2 family multidrug resistance protein-like MFS transporter